MTATIIQEDTYLKSDYPRQLVRNSAGIPFIISYVWVSTTKHLRVWYGNSSTPTSFSIADQANEYVVTTGYDINGTLGAAIDSNDVIHIAFMEFDYPVDSHINYITFDTSSGLWGGIENIQVLPYYTPATPHGAGISIDSNNIPHVVWSTGRSDSLHSVYYNNKIGGVWNGAGVMVDGGTTRCTYSAITIDADNKPFISFYETDTGSGSYINLALGNANDAANFTIYRIFDYLTSAPYIFGSIQLSLAVDINGDHYIGYIEGSSNHYPTFRRHIKSDSWSTWQTAISFTGHSSNDNDFWNPPSIAIDGTDVYLFYYISCTFYGDPDNGIRVAWTTYKNGVWAVEDVVETSLWDITVQWAYWVDNDSTGANKGITGGRNEISFVWFFETDYEGGSNHWHNLFDTTLPPVGNIVQMIIEMN